MKRKPVLEITCEQKPLAAACVAPKIDLEEFFKKILEIPCKQKRLVMGQIKAGKTYKELGRMYESGSGFFNIIIVINDSNSKTQTIEQAEEVGFAPQDILDPKLFKMKNNKYGSLAGKIIVVNLNENYDTRVSDIINEAHSQGLWINYTADEYDVNAVICRLNTILARHEIEQRWINGLHKDDIYTCISATNAVAYYCPYIDFTEVIKLKPWHAKYKGPNDIEIRTMDDFTAYELCVEGKVGSSLINRIKKENTKKKKALVKSTNYVKWDKDNPRTHANLLKQFLAAGINAIAINSSCKYDKKKYDEAVVVIVGAVANRTKEFKDIYTQYLDFGEKLWDGAILQALRLCGARAYTPILYISESKRKKLEAAIQAENKIYSEMSSSPTRNRSMYISKHNIPLPNKIDGQRRERKKTAPSLIIGIDEYTSVLHKIYPMIDTINYNETKGTRTWTEKDVDYIVNSLLNTFSKDRVQNRNVVIPNSDGIIPLEGEATSIRLGLYYEEGMTKFATYYVDPETFEVKIALWEIDPNAEEEDLFHVKTEGRAAA